MRVRGGRGLGDAIYIRPIAEHFVRRGERVSVLSAYADVFLGSGAKVEPFDRIAEVVAHYVGRKGIAGTTQWQDVCLSAGVDVPLAIGWKVHDPQLLYRVVPQAKGRPIVLVHGGRLPMNRADGFGREMLPEPHAFGAVLAELRAAGCYLVQVGHAEQLYELEVDLDLNGKTTVAQLFDLAWSCDAMVAQCSFMVPLAEAFDKPLLAVWAARGLASNEAFIRTTTPEKVLSGARDVYVMDDWCVERQREVAREFHDIEIRQGAFA